VETALKAFLQTLSGFRIVLPADAPSSRPAELDAAAAAADAFTPECKEYRDVQELLYADPIHEVEEETGWTPEKS
jgi:hypothetical protein